jgi:hypothetical protein
MNGSCFLAAAGSFMGIGANTVRVSRLSRCRGSSSKAIVDRVQLMELPRVSGGISDTHGYVEKLRQASRSSGGLYTLADPPCPIFRFPAAAGVVPTVTRSTASGIQVSRLGGGASVYDTQRRRRKPHSLPWRG